MFLKLFFELADKLPTLILVDKKLADPASLETSLERQGPKFGFQNPEFFLQKTP